MRKQCLHEFEITEYILSIESDNEYEITCTLCGDVRYLSEGWFYARNIYEN